ncbi:MAG: LLM class F420-dependent oxidoreductase [Alphaproteobacteria bacterium]
MDIGLAFPTTEIGNDPGVIRDFAETADEAGFAHMTFIDHVVQAAEPNPGWQSYYTVDRGFHEIMVLLGFCAAVTKQVKLQTAILILPQRQTALVAKQAAEIDVLSGGRLRLGVGIGWNEIEYRAMGENFKTRARRIEEQVQVLRALWTQRLAPFHGEFDDIPEVGVNPRPIQQPIPIWIGAFDARAVARAGRLADGWLMNPRMAPGNEAGDAIATFKEAATGAGRAVDTLGIEATIHLVGKSPDEWARELDAWRRLGATQVTLRTMDAGLSSPAEHIDILRQAFDALSAR